MDAILKTEVDLSGLMKVLGDNLYSTPDVALRELVQNGHDSCVRRRLEEGGRVESRITVRADPTRLTLSIEDNGAGLTRDEVQRYLATVGAGYTRTLRDSGRGEGLIGYFGLGFLSAFVVAENTQVHTCSYQTPEEAWMFASRTGETYTLRPGAARPVGTTVTLQLKARFARLAEPDVVLGLLARYTSLLSLPVFCDDVHVNRTPPPWRDPEAAGDALEGRRRAQLFAERFETRYAPLFTMPLPQKGGKAAHGAEGLLWIQDASSYGSLDNRRAWVFVRGMMVSDDERELLPRWAGFCGATIACDALTPTASRESIQNDAVYQAVKASIHEALVHGLAEVARRQRAAWERFLLRHNEALLGAAIADAQLFELLADEVTIPTSEGDMTVGAALERSSGRLYLSRGEGRGFEELLFRALKVPVLDGTRYGTSPFCGRYVERRGGEVVQLGTDAGNQALFEATRLGGGRDERVAGWFAAEDVEVVVARFEPSFLPLVLVPDREVELKRRLESDEANKRIASAALSLARLYTASIASEVSARLYVNADCPAILALFDAAEGPRQTALTLLKALVSMNSEWSQDGRYMDVDEALAAYCQAIERIVAPAAQEA